MDHQQCDNARELSWRQTGCGITCMSVLWEYKTDTTHYSVRSHGASIRLFSNGVFHSQWNPERPFAGGVWDMLSLPVLYRPPESVRRILLLGVGGGAVIRQLQHLVNFESVVAVDIDPVHLQVARQWFGVDDPRIELIEADAIDWLAQLDQAPFDLVIDDLFGHDEGEPVRAVPLTLDWVMQLKSHLNPSGLLSVNCVDGSELKRALPSLTDAGFEFGSRWSLSSYENVIATVGVSPLHSRDWSRRLEQIQLPSLVKRQARAARRRPLHFSADD